MPCNRFKGIFLLIKQVSNITNAFKTSPFYISIEVPDSSLIKKYFFGSLQYIFIKTGDCVTTFKAGEDRFLNSLLVSGDGRYL